MTVCACGVCAYVRAWVSVGGRGGVGLLQCKISEYPKQSKILSQSGKFVDIEQQSCSQVYKSSTSGIHYYGGNEFGLPLRGQYKELWS